MGFRCPNCKKDFGFGEDAKEALHQHLSENVECNVEAWKYTTLFERCLDREKKTSKTPKNKRTYTKIADHHWIKQNIVSDKDGYDIVVCSKCGLKAKRRLEEYKFDLRQIKKIENCNN